MLNSLGWSPPPPLPRHQDPEHSVCTASAVTGLRRALPRSNVLLLQFQIHSYCREQGARVFILD